MKLNENKKQSHVLCLFRPFTILVFAIAAWFSGGADKPKKVQKLHIKTLNTDPVCFHICGESQAKVNSAKKKLQELIDGQYRSQEIQENAIQNFSEGDCQHIADIQRRLGVSVSTKNIQDQLGLVISGHKLSVYEANDEISVILRKAKERRDTELAALMAAWQYQSPTGMKNFNIEMTYKLEQALQNQDKEAKVTIDGQKYTVNMPSGPATDNQGRTLEIKRIDLTEGTTRSRLS